MNAGRKFGRMGGYTLLEISVVLVILAVVTGVALKVGTQRADVNTVEEMDDSMNAIEAALISYRKANDRLPCPSDITAAVTAAGFGRELAPTGTCTGANFGPSGTTVAGGVPTKALGLADKYAFDVWGRRILYAVDTRITAAGAFVTYPITDTTIIGSINVKDASGGDRTLRGLVALVSFGKNGHGAYLRAGGATRQNASSTNTDELKNCHCDAAAAATAFDNIFVQKAATQSTTATDIFDDVVRYKLRFHFKDDNDLSGEPDATPSSDIEVAVGSWSFPNTMFTYTRSGDTFTENTTAPSVYPAGETGALAFSSDNVYLAAVHSGSSPYLYIYKRSGLLLTKLPDPLVLPTSAARLAFTPDTTYLAVTQTVSPYLTIYKRSGDTFTKIPGPLLGPGNEGHGIAFSPDGFILAVGQTRDPLLTLYKRSGDTFRQLPTVTDKPFAAPWEPWATSYDLSFSPNNAYLAVVNNMADKGIYIYKREGDSFTKLADPATIPGGGAVSVGWSQSSTYLAVGTNVAPYIFVYKRSDDTFTKLADLPATATTRIDGVGFSSDDTYLGLTQTLATPLAFYKRSDDSFTLLPTPTPMPTQHSTRIDFRKGDKPENLSFVTGDTAAPRFNIYTLKPSTDVFTRIANPSTAIPQYPISMRFSNDNKYLAMGVMTQLSYNLYVYKVHGTKFTKVADLIDEPDWYFSGRIEDIAWSPDDKYLTVVQADIDGFPMHTFKRTGDVFVEMAVPSPSNYQAGANAGYSVDYSSDGKLLATGMGAVNNPTNLYTSPLAIYERSGDVLNILPPPADIQFQNHFSVRFSPDGNYIAAGIQSFSTSPRCVRIYKRSGKGFTDLSTVDNAASANCSAISVSWSPEGDHLAAVTSVSPYIAIFKRSDDTFTRLPDVSSIPGLPSGRWNLIDYSADGQYLGYVATTDPKIVIYKRSDDTYTKVTDPVNLSTNAPWAIAFTNPPPVVKTDLLLCNDNSGHMGKDLLYPYSVDYDTDTFTPSIPPNTIFSTATVPYGAVYSPDNKYVALLAGGLQILKEINGVLTLLPPPASVPMQATGAAFSSDGTYLTVASSSPAGIYVYKRSGDTFTRLADPTPAIAGTPYGIDFGADDEYMAVSTTDNAVGLYIYKRTGDTFTGITTPASLLSSIKPALDISNNGNYLAITSWNAPYLMIYRRNGNVFTKLPDPAIMPTGMSFAVKFSNDDSFLAVMQQSTANVIYARTGDTFTKLAAAVPNSGTGFTAASYSWSENDTYLATTTNTLFTGDNLAILKRTGTGAAATFALLPDPVSPTAWKRCATFKNAPKNVSDIELVFVRDQAFYIGSYKLVETTDPFTVSPFIRRAVPAVTPGGAGRTITISPNNRYIASTNLTSTLTVYKDTNGTLTKIADPAVFPSGSAQAAAAWSADNKYFAVGTGAAAGNVLFMYKLEDDVLNHLSGSTGPNYLPTTPAAISAVNFSPDGNYFALNTNQAPYTIAYKRIGDRFNRLAGGVGVQHSFAANNAGLDFSADSNYLAVTSTALPYLYIFKRSGDRFNKLANPATLPGASAGRTRFSHTMNYLAVLGSAPRVMIYKRAGDTFTDLIGANGPQSQPPSTVYDVAWSWDDTYMAVGHMASPYITIYKRSGDTFTKTANPWSVPGANYVNGVDFRNQALATAPITNVTPPANGNYNASQVLNFVVNYLSAVTVTGTPRLAIDLGGVTRYATYVSGSGTDKLMFRYTVVAADSDMDGITITSPIDLNSGTIVKSSNNVAAGLDFTVPSLTGVLVAGGVSGCSSSQLFSGLNGTNGTKLYDVTIGNSAGYSVSDAGDVNGDGYDDVIVGALKSNGRRGYSYVVFGKAAGWASTMAFNTLDGTNGFRLDGTNVNDDSGEVVSSAGDVNGDGYDDILVGAWRANGMVGYTYVVFGKATWGATLALSTLNGTDGFRLDGDGTTSFSGEFSSSAGDVNSDGYDDIIVGVKRGDSNKGYAFVIFGKPSGWAASATLTSLADGTAGFRLDGTTAADYFGHSMSSAGDVNGDGFDDIIVGAIMTSGGSRGAAYVIFGKASGWAANMAVNTLNGTNGFRLDGTNVSELAGQSVSNAGDVNGDGFDDMLVGAHTVNSNRGYTYVVFGKPSGWASSIALSSLNGTTGFRLDGIDNNDYSGFSVSNAGDVNGDGFDDILVGAYGASGINGESYIVYGKASGWASTMVLNTLNGANGYLLYEASVSTDYSSRSVSIAGDVNGDGRSDVIVGSPYHDPLTVDAAGAAYLVFGKSCGLQ